jgi:hypothetical protein
MERHFSPRSITSTCQTPSWLDDDGGGASLRVALLSWQEWHGWQTDGRDWKGPLASEYQGQWHRIDRGTLFLVYSISCSEANLWPPARLLNLLPLVRLRTSPHSRRYGVTITGLLVTIYPAGHPRYGDARSKSQLSSLLKCLHVHISFFMANTIHG